MEFVELPAFTSRRKAILSDSEYKVLLQTLSEDPQVGQVMRGMAGLRKMRFRDARNSIGTRGGLRVIYLLIEKQNVCVLYFVYRKSEKADLNPRDRAFFRELTEQEIKQRRK